METLLNDRYLILKSLGKGGFSETFLAKDYLSSALRVVKSMKLPAAASPSKETTHDLFEAEVQTLYQLGHLSQQIPALYDHFVEERSLYLVQEFIDGDNLEVEKDQLWTPEKIIKLLRQILTALQFLHSHQVIHGDIKPRNIIRRKDGRLVLIDFGAVKIASDQATQLAEDVVVGTAGYMPNEQQTGRSRFSSDLYALGMVAVQCLTGVHPRDLEEDHKTGEIQWQSRVDLPPQLTKIVRKLVKVRLRDRYTSATEVLLDLDKLEQGTQPQRSIQVLYSGVICLLLVGGIIGIGRTFTVPNKSSAHSSPYSSFPLQVLSLSIPITTLAALIRLRLW